MGVLTWIILGGVAGWITSLITGNHESMGLIGNIVVGVIGAIVGGFIMNAFGYASVTGFNLYSTLVAVFGSIVFLFILGMLKK